MTTAPPYISMLKIIVNTDKSTIMVLAAMRAATSGFNAMK